MLNAHWNQLLRNVRQDLLQLVEVGGLDHVVIESRLPRSFAVGFLALGILSLVMASPWFAPLLIIPAVLSAYIVRLRTVARVDSVTARTLAGSFRRLG